MERLSAKSHHVGASGAPKYRETKWQRLWIIVIAVIVVLAIAIAVPLGVALSKSKSNQLPTFANSIYNNASAMVLANYSAILGSITFDGTSNTTLNFSTITYAGSDFSIGTVNGNPALTLVVITVLQSVMGQFSVQGNVVLLYLDVPLLAYIKDSVVIANNPALAHGSLSQGSRRSNIANSILPSLTHVVGDVDISNSNLTTISFPSLASIDGDVNIFSNLQLNTVSMITLGHIDSALYIYSNVELTSISFATLTYVGDNVYVHGNSALSSISAPNMQLVEDKAGAPAIDLCGNAASPSVSYQLTNAAAGKSCKIAPNFCASTGIVSQSGALCCLCYILTIHAR